MKRKPRRNATRQATKDTVISSVNELLKQIQVIGDWWLATFDTLPHGVQFACKIHRADGEQSSLIELSAECPYAGKVTRARVLLWFSVPCLSSMLAFRMQGPLDSIHSEMWHDLKAQCSTLEQRGEWPVWPANSAKDAT